MGEPLISIASQQPPANHSISILWSFAIRWATLVNAFITPNEGNCQLTKTCSLTVGLNWTLQLDPITAWCVLPWIDWSPNYQNRSIQRWHNRVLFLVRGTAEFCAQWKWSIGLGSLANARHEDFQSSCRRRLCVSLSVAIGIYSSV